MAALARPLISAAAKRVMAALGIGGAAGVAGEAAREQAKRRQETSERTRSEPIAQTETTTKERKKCKDCTPDRGAPFIRSTNGWSDVSIAYQARIGGMPAGAGFITEWLFNGVTFDGFDSGQCLLKEAKAKYDQFFDLWGLPQVWWTQGADKVIQEAYRQAAVAQPRPPVQLRWHFMETKSYRYFHRIITAAYPDIQVVFQP